MACESAEIAESSQNPSNTFLPASNNEGEYLLWLYKCILILLYILCAYTFLRSSYSGSAPPSSHISPPSAGHRRKSNSSAC